jgi:hypothetical protein
MPQASDRLRAKFSDDGEAWAVLMGRFDQSKGHIYPKVQGYEPTEQENDAIAYLCDEWDWCLSSIAPAEHERRMKVIHAIWLCAHIIGEKPNDMAEITEMAAKIVGTPADNLFDGWDRDYLDRAWCSRPSDWKPVDSLA